MVNVVVLGGGTGGTAVANQLARHLGPELRRGRVRLVLLSDDPYHTYQPGFLATALGKAPLGRFRRPLRSLLLPGVELQVDPARLVDTRARVVEGESGRRYPFDYLVLATGAHPFLEDVPGLAEAGHTFYTPAGARRLQQALASFAGGRIVLTVGIPHKCPVAPLEMALLLDDELRRRDLRERTELVYTYPIQRLHVLPEVSRWAEEEFARRGILSQTFFNLERVEVAGRVAVSLEGMELPFDLLIHVPAHRGAGVVRDSGLADREGFVPADRFSLEVVGQQGIYVVGDASNLPVSKAGSTAHYQAEVVAANLAALVRHETPAARYDGKVFCFIEAGQAASFVEFGYLRPPSPAPASPALAAMKAAYGELYWLTARGLL
ncbi:MAG TPA: FAD-dependent oxidoreductase [Limnochordales bacterium]